MNFIIMVHMEHTTINGGTTCEFEMARRIFENGYPVKIYYPYGSITSGIYDNYATLEDVNDDTVAIYCAHRFGNPLNAKRVVRWVAYGLDKYFYDTFNDTDIIYYHFPFCKNNLLANQKLFSCFLSPEAKNMNLTRVHKLCYIIKKGYKFWKTITRRDTNTLPHNIFFNDQSILDKPINLEGQTFTQLDHIQLFNKTTYFYCYDPCCFLVIIALLCGCIVIQDPVDGYTEEEWMYACGVPTRLKGFAYGIENLKYAEDTIQNAYGPCMELVNQSDVSIKQFLYDMKHYTYNMNKCYAYSESPCAFMF
jgi:hypothetical protein